MIRLQRITTADTDLYSYMEKLNTDVVVCTPASPVSAGRTDIK